MRQIFSAVVLLAAACSEPRNDKAASPSAIVPTYDGAAVTEASAKMAHGKRLVDVLGCKGCHGSELQGEMFAEQPGYGSIHASNLTVGLNRWSGAQVEAALRTGRRPDGSELWAMPSEMYTHLNEPDMSALVAYLRTLQPIGKATPPKKMEAGWKADIASGKAKSAVGYIAEEKGVAPVDLGPQLARGRMITMTACTECHAAKLEGRDGTPNLDVVGAYSQQQFTTLMRTGKPPSGKELKMMSGVARGRFSKLTDKELADLYRYLQARAQKVR